MEQLFRKIRQLIAEKDFETLSQLEIPQPEKFNWVKEVFEDIHVEETPGATALLWTDGNETRHYSFAQISAQSNKLLNFLRNKGVMQHDVLLTQMALQPVNWLAMLATI